MSKKTLNSETSCAILFSTLGIITLTVILPGLQVMKANAASYVTLVAEANILDSDQDGIPDRHDCRPLENNLQN